MTDTVGYFFQQRKAAGWQAVMDGHRLPYGGVPFQLCGHLCTGYLSFH